jgi:hypothetical protein
MPQPSPDRVAGHGVSDGFGHDEPGARDAIIGWADANMDHQAAAAGATPTAKHRGEVAVTPQTLGGREHALVPHWQRQAERRARPLDRRAEITARPARVRMRRRNPWVFARRRLLGW